MPWRAPTDVARGRARRRDPGAFRNDVIEAGHAIVQAVDGIRVVNDDQSLLIRSSVEREFTLTGEALTPGNRPPAGRDED